MSGAQEAILTLAKTLSGAGEDEEPLLEALCQAAELRRTAQRLMAPFTVPGDFAFRGVRG